MRMEAVLDALVKNEQANQRKLEAHQRVEEKAKKESSGAG